MLRYSFILLFGLSFCDSDEATGGYGAVGSVWKLSSLNGAEFTAKATFEFGEEGAFFGKAPCNNYRGSLTAEYPTFSTSPIISTQMACPDLEAESAYLAALASMTTAAVAENTMTLTNDEGGSLVFDAVTPAN